MPLTRYDGADEQEQSDERHAGPRRSAAHERFHHVVNRDQSERPIVGVDHEGLVRAFVTQHRDEPIGGKLMRHSHDRPDELTELVGPCVM